MVHKLEFRLDQPDNLSVIRLLAALAVIFGHSFALAMGGKSGVQEPFSLLLPGTYSGALAVQAFFFISGLLITHSLLRNADIERYAHARALRVIPAFLAMLLVSVLVLAPMTSSLSYPNYVLHPDTIVYLLNTGTFTLLEGPLGLRPLWALPETFAGQQSAALNGSLWSLFLEVKLYALSAILFIAAAGKRKLLLLFGYLFLFATIYRNALAGSDFFVENAVFMYALGMLCRLHARHLFISVWPMLIALALTYYWRHSPYAQLCYAISIASMVLFVGFHSQLPKLKLPGDYSYGVFLWGFPVQQLIAWYLPHLGPYRMFALASLIALLLGALSWHYLEKPALALKSRWTKHAQ